MLAAFRNSGAAKLLNFYAAPQLQRGWIFVMSLCTALCAATCGVFVFNAIVVATE